MDEVENIKREILQYISSVFDVLSKDINTDEINIEIQNKSHKNPKFCDGNKTGKTGEVRQGKTGDGSVSWIITKQGVISDVQ